MREGEVVPDFILPDQHGVHRRLTDLLADGPVVLFFYPAAMTPGCTREACHFRDLAGEFEAAGLQRVGISCDPPAKQKAFAQRYHLDYPLLSDGDGSVATQFGVRRGWLGRRAGIPVQRATFVIGTDRKIVKAYRSELDMSAHADVSFAAQAVEREGHI
jgi:peroxiredoxin Q/BCP